MLIIYTTNKAFIIPNLLIFRTNSFPITSCSHSLNSLLINLIRNGASGRTRTCTRRLIWPVLWRGISSRLYQLSYRGNSGGSGEIRTHGPFRIVCFQDRCNKPDSATLPIQFSSSTVYYSLATYCCLSKTEQLLVS